MLNLIIQDYCCFCNISIYNKNYICEDCKSKLQLLKSNYNCKKESAIYYDENYSLYSYNQILQSLIFYFKTKSIKGLHKYFSNEIFNYIINNKILADIITFVPVLNTKKKKRGFNQTEIIAKRISKKMKINCIDTLSLDRNKIDQKKLNFTQRYFNIIGSFKIKKNVFKNIKNKDILIIDDIFTTGATINECSRILKKNGAKRVFSLTLGMTKNIK